MTHPYRAFARALERAWQVPGRFLLALAGMIGIGLMDPALVLYTREVVDQYFMRGQQGGPALGILLFACIFALRGTFVFGTGRIMAALAADVLVTIQKDMFALKRRGDGADGTTSHLLIGLLSEAKQSTDLIEKVIVKYIRSGFNLLALLASLAYLQPLVALICTAMLVPTAWMCARLGAHYERAAGDYVRSNQKMLAYCSDAASAASLLGRLCLDLKRQHSAAQGLAATVASHYRTMYLRAGTLVPFTQMLLGFSLVMLIYLVQAGLIGTDAATLAAIATNLFLLHAPLRDLVEAHAAVLRGAVGQRWVDTGHSAPARHRAAPAGEDGAAAVLEARWLDAAGGAGLLAVAAGAITVVDGVQGIVVMRACEAIMLGQRNPSVALHWRGVDLSGMSVDAVAETCFYANSAVPLYEADLAANVACDAKPDPERVRSSLTEAGLGEWLESLPAGIASHIGSQGIRLSGGQRQLLALARAFYLSRPVVMLNDPTSALDPESEQRFCESLRKLARSSAVLVCSHRGALHAIDNAREELRHAY